MRASFFALRLPAALSGCATLEQPRSPDTIASGALEAAFQTSNAIDYAQTINTARRPDCLAETGPTTSQIIGEHPTESRVAAMWVAQSAVHYLVTAWLDREVDATDGTGWRVARMLWHGVAPGDSLRNVVHNSEIGLRPFGDGASPECHEDTKLARRK